MENMGLVRRRGNVDGGDDADNKDTARIFLDCGDEHEDPPRHAKWSMSDARIYNNGLRAWERCCL